MGLGFSIFHSRKHKLFTAEEQSKIDKICRGLDKFTKKKFTITSYVEENRDYGDYHGNDQIFNNDIVTQTIKYTYEFDKKLFELFIYKVWPTTNDQINYLLRNSSKKWDYEDWYIKKHLIKDYPKDFSKDEKEENIKETPKNFREKDIGGIRFRAEGSIKDPWKKLFLFTDMNLNHLNNMLLISYNSNWDSDFQDYINKIFKTISENLE